MNMLLLRLAGPMQSWGTQSRFTTRDTGLEPSKSGVVGLICAALGRARSQPVEDVAALRMGVRVDHEPIMASDYHTTLDVVKASGAKPKAGEAVVSVRYYLTDGDFLVGLESTDLSLLEQIHAALGDPYWPLFLGRKAFPPAMPVRLADGLWHKHDLRQALVEYPRCHRVDDDRVTELRLVLEDTAGEAVRIDQPVSSLADRRFAPRRVKTEFIPLSQIPVCKEETCISPS
jgi:CRISPR system Cascade subunit CasD